MFVNTHNVLLGEKINRRIVFHIHRLSNASINTILFTKCPYQISSLLKDMELTGFGAYPFLAREINELLKGRTDATFLNCACGTGAVGKEAST